MVLRLSGSAGTLFPTIAVPAEFSTLKVSEAFSVAAGAKVCRESRVREEVITSGRDVQEAALYSMLPLVEVTSFSRKEKVVATPLTVAVDFSAPDGISVTTMFTFASTLFSVTLMFAALPITGTAAKKASALALFAVAQALLMEIVAAGASTV